MKCKGALGLLLLTCPCHASATQQRRRKGREVQAKEHREVQAKEQKQKVDLVLKQSRDVIDFVHPPPPKKQDALKAVEFPDTANLGRLRIDESSLHDLATTYEGGWVQDGIMFDVRVNSNDASASQGIVVLGLDILTPASFETVCVEIYSREGGYKGFDTVQSAWEFLGSVTVLGLGKDTPTIIPLGSFDPVYIAPNSTRAFYVTTQDESMRYTAYSDGEQTSGSVFASSDEGGVNVDILMGVAKNYPFAQSWPDRIFNGAIRYTIGSNVDLDITSLSADQATQAETAKRGKITCDVDASATSPPSTSVPALNSPVTAAPTVAATGPPSISPTATAVISTASPTEGLSEPPTPAPTTLAFTMKKVATTLHGGLKQAGVMFDVRVPAIEEGGPAEGLSILTFEVSTFLTDEICVEVYSKEGTHVGYETDVVKSDDGSWSSDTWAILGSVTTTGMGETVPTHLPVGAIDPIYIGPGETRAYYVTMTIPEMRYTQPAFREKTGDVFVASSMGHLQIMVGTAKSYPFLDSWADRIFNGAVLYALGEVEDGKYSNITANDRSRSCLVLGGAPTGSPSVSVEETSSPVAQGTPTQSPIIQVISTQAPVSTGGESITTTINPTVGDLKDVVETSSASSSPRLDDICPGFELEDISEKKEVVVEYTYALITNTTDNSAEFVIENLMHTKLMQGKCSEMTVSKRNQKVRLMQESITYYGFNSNPPDEVVTGEECTGVTLATYEECTIVQGGFTAYVPNNVDESSVQNDLGQFANEVLLDAKNHDALGVNNVIVESDADSSKGEINSATSEQQSQDGTDESNGRALTPTAIIIIAAVAGCVALAVILMFISSRHKKTKRAKANEELFHEFREEQTDVGPDYGSYSKNVDNKSTNSSAFNREDEESTLFRKAPVILNEHDEISLVSNDFSKSRFIIPPTPGTPGSDASRSSRGSVKFVRAGESFTSRSHQPEDTVDL
ncbi:hypothetical protein ACHAWX_002719 [Stephanocyclus meneghinianus]